MTPAILALFNVANRDPRLRGEDRRVFWEVCLLLPPESWGAVPDWHVGGRLSIDPRCVGRALRRLVRYRYLARDRHLPMDRRTDRRYRLVVELADQRAA